MENCQDKAGEYVSVNGLLIQKNELQNFKELYRGYDYTLIKHDEEHYFAHGFVKQANILAQGIAGITAVKPIYLPYNLEKSKHPKTAAQKKNKIEKRRKINKARKTHRK